MIRGLGVSIVLAILAAAAGVGMLLVKHGVKEQEALLAQRLHEIQRGQDDIHVLNAEWTYLSDPVRVAALAEKHLGMRVVAPTQIVTLDTLPASTVQTPPVTVAKADISRPPVVVKSAPVAKPEGVKPDGASQD